MERLIEQCSPGTRLGEAGLSKTPQRLAVMRLLINAKRPVTAGDILDGINGSLKINRVTVYRIMTTLKHKGIVREIPTADGINFYEMACIHNPNHPHFYCTGCKTMTCLEPLTQSETRNLLGGAKNFIIEGLSVNITGLCETCRRKRKSIRTRREEK